MRMLLAIGVMLAAAGCWMDEFEAATSHNERALDAYESGELVDDTFAQAPISQAQAQQAVESYYADYGRYPSSLEELVPDYLEQVPRKADGTPLSYNPETGAISN